VPPGSWQLVPPTYSWQLVPPTYGTRGESGCLAPRGTIRGVSKRGLTLSDPTLSFGLRGVSKGSDPFLKQSLRARLSRKRESEAHFTADLLQTATGTPI
jgi:hypothetical protein